MMTNRQLRRIDLVSAPLLLLISGAVVFSGLQMPMEGTYAGRPIHWYTSPGLFPVLIGSILFLCALGVLRRALIERAHRGWRHWLGKVWRRDLRGRSTGRAAVVWVLIGGYIAVLAVNVFGPLSSLIENRVWAQSVWTRFLTEPDGVNYLLGSFLFLCTFMLAFHRPLERRSRWRTRVLIVAGSAALSWGVSCVFTEVLLTPLP